MSINIKECKRFFDQALADVKNISIQCSEVVRQYESIQWGPYIRFDLKDEADGIIGRYIPLLNELRNNVGVFNEQFTNLIDRFKAKQINSMDLNFEIINLSQNMMSYLEYLGTSGLPELSRALMIKQMSYNNTEQQNAVVQPNQTEVAQ